MFRFAKEGYPFIFTSLIVVILFYFSGLVIPWAVSLVVTAFMFFFFRDPDRQVLYDSNAFCSPADGKIILIDEAYENEVLHRKALRISIFMSPLNVHVNRSPCDGVVKEVKYFPGRFFSAFKHEAPVYNEHISMLLENERHGSIVVKQIAGSMARRAVCRVSPGDVLRQGQRYGIIKFSSRVDIYLPLDTEIRVKLNEKVKAGVTILGTRTCPV